MEARDYVNDLRGWGFTQAQIAELTGIPQPTISKIERGDVEDVLSRTYRRLQAAHQLELAKRPVVDQPYADMPREVRRAVAGEGSAS
jgi:transcriptional regulator with XRE-family HTH domain